MTEFLPKVKHFIDSRRGFLASLCSSIVKISTENPPGDTRKAVDFISSFLEERGISSKIVEPKKGHANLVARIRGGSDDLILCSHLDVVPAGDRGDWHLDPFSGKIQGGRVFGRGASDAKGGIAGFLLAMEGFRKWEKDLDRGVTLALVCDEETGEDYGAKWLIEKRLIKGEGCIVAEPSYSSDGKSGIALGERGVIWIQLAAKGRSAHGSTPAFGKNAIHSALRFIERFSRIADISVRTPRELKGVIQNARKPVMRYARSTGIPILEATKVFNHCTVNLGVIHGGTKVNMVPDHCTAQLDIRIPYGATTALPMKFLRESLTSDLSYKILTSFNPTWTSPDNAFVRKMIKCAEASLGTSILTLYAATTDARLFRGLGKISTINFGPGSRLHTANEFVSIRELVEAARFYTLAGLAQNQ